MIQPPLIAGGTLLGEVDAKGKHLIIVCSSPVFYDENTPGYDAVLTVSVTSWRDNQSFNDDSCIFMPGDHSFIRHKSFAYYLRAVPWRVDPLLHKIENNEIKVLERLSKEKLRQVLDGFEKSPFTQPKTLRFYKRYVKTRCN